MSERPSWGYRLGILASLATIASFPLLLSQNVGGFRETLCNKFPGAWGCASPPAPQPQGPWPRFEVTAKGTGIYLAKEGAKPRIVFPPSGRPDSEVKVFLSNSNDRIGRVICSEQPCTLNVWATDNPSTPTTTEIAYDASEPVRVTRATWLSGFAVRLELTAPDLRTLNFASGDYTVKFIGTSVTANDPVWRIVRRANISGPYDLAYNQSMVLTTVVPR